MVEYGIKIHTGDLAVDYGDVDLYLVGCDRVWRFYYIPTGDFVADYSAVDLHWVHCCRLKV